MIDKPQTEVRLSQKIRWKAPDNETPKVHLWPPHARVHCTLTSTHRHTHLHIDTHREQTFNPQHRDSDTNGIPQTCKAGNLMSFRETPPLLCLYLSFFPPKEQKERNMYTWEKNP